MPAASAPAPPKPDLNLRLLGTPAWCRQGEPWRALTRKDAVLLALLALEGRQPRSHAAALLWPDVPAPRAHANLRQRLFRLRHSDAELVSEQDQVLSLAEGLRCDVWRDGCSDHADLGATLLAGLAVEDDEAQRWIDQARHLWSARRIDLLGAQAARLEQSGALAESLAATEQLLALEPLLEHAWRRLMRLHTLRGDRAAAVAAFERCERTLGDELGLKPSAETLALLSDVEALGAVTLSGAAARRLPAALLRPPRLVGRVAERQAAAAAWAAGAVFVVIGEAGLGKSRLLAELAAQDVGRVLESARPGDESVGYGALARLLRAMALAAPRPQALWPQGAARQELARLLPELGPAPVAPGLQALLHAAFDQVFEQAGVAGLRVILFDDLQHADEATRAVLRRVCAGGQQPGPADAPAPPRLCWALASRPDERADWQDWLASSTRLHPVVLQGLGGDELQDLLASLDLPGLDPRVLGPALSRHCGGNPLFVLETLKHLALQPEAHAGSPERLPLPASVEMLLAQRLARLSDAAQGLARVAAVAGADFDAEVAADVMGLPLMALAAPWHELQQAQVLREDRFAHESVQDAVLLGLPQPLRVPLHARVARSLQQHGAPPQRVASHFHAAGDPASAAAVALSAAAQALRLGRTAERLGHLRHAVQWFGAAGQHEQALHASVAEVEACLAHEGLEAAKALAASLLPRARTRDQRVAVRLAQAGVGLAGYDIALTLEAAAAALAEVEPGSAAELSVMALQAAGQAVVGQSAQALATVVQLRPRLDGLTDPLAAALLWSHCAVVFNSAGNARDCIAALERQRQLSRQAGHAELEASALASLSGQWCSLGDSELSVRQSREASALHRRMGADNAALMSDINLVIALIGIGELREAVAVLDQARKSVHQTAAASDLGRMVADLQMAIALRLGRPEGVLTLLQEAPAQGLSLAGRLNRLSLRAQAAQLMGDPQQARDLWCALQLQVPDNPATGLHLRCLALASVTLPPQQARAQLDRVLQRSLDSHFPAGQALALMRRAALCLGLGELAQAEADALSLIELRPRARHLFVDEAELRAQVCLTLDAVGQSEAAAAQRQQAQAWVEQQVACLPPGCEATWRAHPAHQGLWH